MARMKRFLANQLEQLRLDLRELAPRRWWGRRPDQPAELAHAWNGPWLWLGVLVALFLLIPTVVFSEFFVGLCADAGDTLGDIGVAILALAISLGAGALLATYLGSVVLHGRAIRWFAWVLIMPLFAGFLSFLHSVDAPSAHWLALAFPLTLLRNARRYRGSRTTAARAAIVILVALFVVRAYTAWPAARLERYSRQLAFGCWCCDLKTRAIAELSAMGPAGYAEIRKRTAADPSWDEETVLSCVRTDRSRAAAELIAWLRERHYLRQMDPCRLQAGRSVAVLAPSADRAARSSPPSAQAPAGAAR